MLNNWKCIVVYIQPSKIFFGSPSYSYRVSFSLCSYGNKYPFILFIYLYFVKSENYGKFCCTNQSYFTVNTSVVDMDPDPDLADP